MKLSISRLSAYTAAATAAVASARADVVYSGPQNINITSGNFLSLDLNSDGQTDLTLKNYVFGGGPYQGATVNLAPGRLVGFIAGAGNFSYVSNLAPGFLINSGSLGTSFFGSLAYGTHNPNAQFNNVTGAYLGLSFNSVDGLRYGWVRVNINNTAGTFSVQDWAYDSTVGTGTGIAAGAIPEPSSLGLLALGAAGLGLYRRRARV